MGFFDESSSDDDEPTPPKKSAAEEEKDGDDDDEDPLDAYMKRLEEGGDQLQQQPAAAAAEQQHERLDLENEDDDDDDDDNMFSSQRNDHNSNSSTREAQQALDTTFRRATTNPAAAAASAAETVVAQTCFWQHGNKDSPAGRAWRRDHQVTLSPLLNRRSNNSKSSNNPITMDPIRSFAELAAGVSFVPTTIKEHDGETRSSSSSLLLLWQTIQHQFAAPTAVQAQTLPLALSGRDCVITAATGQGTLDDCIYSSICWLLLLLPVQEGMNHDGIRRMYWSAICFDLGVRFHHTFFLELQNESIIIRKDAQLPVASRRALLRQSSCK